MKDSSSWPDKTDTWTCDFNPLVPKLPETWIHRFWLELHDFDDINSDFWIYLIHLLIWIVLQVNQLESIWITNCAISITSTFEGELICGGTFCGERRYVVQIFSLICLLFHLSLYELRWHTYNPFHYCIDCLTQALI